MKIKAVLVTLFFTTKIAATPLTVATVLSMPSHQVISCSLEPLNVKRNELDQEMVDTLSELAHALLRGDHARREEILAESRSFPGITHSKGSGKSLWNNKKIAAFIDSTLTDAKNLVLAAAPSASLIVVKGLFDAWSSTRSKLSVQESHQCQEDSLIRRTPLLDAAHRIAFDAIIKLFLILYSPQTNACERMQALFLLNHVQLLGKKGRLFHDFMSRSNRYYFTPDGIIRCYDPSKCNSTLPRRVKELSRFVAIMCSTDQQLASYVVLASHQGIPGFDPHKHCGTGARLKQRSKSTFWNYATGMIKEIAGYDIATVRTVEPAIVRQRTVTKDFMRLIERCAQIEPSQDQSSPAQIVAQARATVQPILDRYAGKRLTQCCRHGSLKRYFQDTMTNIIRASRKL